MSQDTLQALLTEILPSNVVLRVADDGQKRQLLSPALEQHIVTAVDKRKMDFRGGRNAAYSALSALGFDKKVDIGVGEKREPLWPKGIVGSITHTSDFYGAIVAWKHDYRSIGFDVETIKPLKEDIQKMICTDTERTAIKILQEKHADIEWSIVFFSIKEAIYKTFYPIYQVYLGFDEAEVTIDDTHQTFSAQVHHRENNIRLQFHGNIIITTTHVCAITHLH